MKKETLIIPKLGLTMESATIVSIKYQVGDAVKEGDVILEFETNKLAKTIDAPFDGYLVEILVEEGDEVDVAKPVCVVGEEL